MRCSAADGIAWRASPRKPIRTSSGWMARKNAEQDPDHGAARADERGERRRRRRVLSAPAAEQAGAAGQRPWPAVGRGQRAGRHGGAGRRRPRGRGDRERRRPSAPMTRAAEQRHARAAGGGQVAEDAGLDVLGAGGRADDRAGDEVSSAMTLERVLVALQAAGRPVLGGVAGVLDGAHGEAERDDAERRAGRRWRACRAGGAA